LKEKYGFFQRKTQQKAEKSRFLSPASDNFPDFP